MHVFFHYLKLNSACLCLSNGVVLDGVPCSIIMLLEVREGAFLFRNYVRSYSIRCRMPHVASARFRKSGIFEDHSKSSVFSMSVFQHTGIFCSTGGFPHEVAFMGMYCQISSSIKFPFIQVSLSSSIEIYFCNKMTM